MCTITGSLKKDKKEMRGASAESIARFPRNGLGLALVQGWTNMNITLVNRFIRTPYINN